MQQEPLTTIDLLASIGAKQLAIEQLQGRLREMEAELAKVELAKVEEELAQVRGQTQAALDEE